MEKKILADPAPHSGKTYPLFGLEELTQYQIAEMVPKVIGRKIAYVPVEIPAFEHILRTDMHASDYFTQHIMTVAQDCIDGYFSETNYIVEEITGKIRKLLKNTFEKPIDFNGLIKLSPGSSFRRL